MSDLADSVRAVIWEHFADLDDPGCDQRAWLEPYVDGMLVASAELGLLEVSEVEAFRAASRGERLPAASGDRAAALAHLSALRDDLRPMSRTEDPEAMAASALHRGALEALLAAGVISEDDAAAARKSALRLEAPWLGEDDLAAVASATGFVAIAVPDASPEGISPDAAAAEEVERLLRVGEVRRVLVPAAISRFDGLAITAVVVRRESVEVLFHFVGPAMEPSPGFASMAAFRAVHDSLVAPRLTDHLGRVYEPVRPGPIQSRGGRPGVSGAWRYLPAPADATAFVVEWLGGRWVISG